jgi:U3 small nucleolar ribonucleoprotein protein IMP3
MVRQFKHHEQKLLKKVDFLNVRRVFDRIIVHFTEIWHQWKQDANLREIKVMRRYHIQDREDYHKYVLLIAYQNSYISKLFPRYNKLCGQLRSYAHRLSLLPAQDPFRSQMEGQLLSKLYDMGVLNTSAKLSDIENKLTVAAFCRRRLAVIMCTSKMAETVSAVCHPAILHLRNMRRDLTPLRR